MEEPKVSLAKWLPKKGLYKQNGYVMPIAARLTAGFLLIIVAGNIIFTIAGIQLIGNRFEIEAQEKVRTDLNAAREIYLNELRHVEDTTRLTAERFFLRDAIQSGEMEQATYELRDVKANEGLDFLSVTDSNGIAIMRTTNPDHVGDNQSQDEIVAEVLATQLPAASTVVVSNENLHEESPLLSERAIVQFVETPKARPRTETEITSGLVLKAAAPVFDDKGNMIGVLYGGVMLNRNYEIVDKIKQTVFQNVEYKGKDSGTATIFLDDVRISTNVHDAKGMRAIGTRISDEVYNQTVIEGKTWLGRAFVVTDWYITAYEPIKNIHKKTIGSLYVGVLEQKYTDLKNQTVSVFLAISLGGILLTATLSLLLARTISLPIKDLASASRELARGNLDVKVSNVTHDELGELADSFNAMAAALRDRDQKLKEYAKKKIMESERLALIGQLSANVAHEINNPLQGIVTYASLALERQTFDEKSRSNIQKIVTQANRCRDIIRGLLDFSRHKNPDKALCNINTLLTGCVSLVENQAIFHNIEIISNLDPSLPMIIVDPSQVERVFLNLIINAAEAMEGSGKLTITTTMDAKTRCIDIDVKDTGPGITDENLEKIFDPFFTTKETGHGVGLGLAISHGIVNEHGGSLTVETEPGKGTTFTVSLPLPKMETGAING
ncbi:MAG: sensor histidine kinase [Chloroflexota bacterium]